MRIGILSDTHDELARTRAAVELLRSEGAEVLVHCGDLAGPVIVAACAVLPCYFVFGNHDADNIPLLRQAALENGVVCLGWGGVVELDGKRIAVAHGHMGIDVRRVLSTGPDYLLFGHSHLAGDERAGTLRRINPGSLHRAEEYTVAILDLITDQLRLLRVVD